METQNTTSVQQSVTTAASGNGHTPVAGDGQGPISANVAVATAIAAQGAALAPAATDRIGQSEANALRRLREGLRVHTIAPPDLSETAATRFIVGTSLSILAIVLKAVVNGLGGEDTGYLPYFLGIVVSASLAGFSAGIITTALLALGQVFLFYGPNGPLTLGTTGSQLRLALFLLDGTFVSAISQALLGARRRAERSGLERERLYDAERAARESAQRAEVRSGELHAITAALSEVLSTEQVADVIVTRGVAALGARAGGLVIVDADGKTVRTVRARGYEPDLVHAYESFPIEASLPATDAIRTGEAVICATADELRSRYPDLATAAIGRGNPAIAAVPFSTSGESPVRGAITLSFPEAQAFGPEDREFMASLAKECGRALDRARLHEAEQRSRSDAETTRAAQEFIANASRLLSSSLDYEATLQRVADLSVPFLADWCSMDILEADGSIRALALAHVDPAGREMLREYRDRFPPKELAHGSAAVIASGETLLRPVVTDADIEARLSDPAAIESAKRLEIRSYLAVPLRSGEEILGAIVFASRTPGHFGPSHAAIAEELAIRATDAIRHARLYREARQLVATVDATLDAVFMFDPVDLRFTYVNQGAINQVGFSREELLSMQALEIKPDFDEARYREMIAPLLAGQRPSITFSTTHLHRDGTRVPVEVFLQAVHLPAGQVRMIITARDIRKQIEVEANLYRLARAERARAAELSAVIRGMGEGVLVCDPSGQVILTNPASATILGAPVERYADLLAMIESDSVELPQLASAAGPVEVRLAGTDRWLDLSTYPVSLETELGPDAETTIIVLRDVTAARRAREAREAFIGVMSHELRTPITTIYGTTKLFKRAGESPELMRSMLADVEAEADRLYRLVEDLLILSRSETGIQIEGEPVLLQHIIRSVVAGESSRWPDTQFGSSVPAGLPPVSGDKTYLEQVVRNLLSNAAKYSPPGTRVDVSAEVSGREIVVRVLDRGPGFGTEEAENLFGLFYRSPTTAKKVTGAGIGLYVCRALIEAMGGRIWARSPDGGGAEFGFTVPILEAEAEVDDLADIASSLY